MLDKNTINENTKVTLAIVASIVLVVIVPLTLYFADTRALASEAKSDNDEQQVVLDAILKDQSDIKADIREIKTILKERNK